jgi:hypothetical protein
LVRRRGAGFPAPLLRKEDKVNAVEKVMRILENDLRPFVEEEVYGLLKTGKVPVEPDTSRALARKVLDEGLKRTRSVLKELWKILDTPPPPKVAKWLRKGGFLEVSGPPRKSERVVEAWVKIRGKEKHEVEWLCFWGPGCERLRGVNLHARAGLVVLSFHTDSHITGDLYITKERAFGVFRRSEALEEASERVRGLSPLFKRLGVADLERAFAVLKELEEGKTWAEGPYVLLREEGRWIVRRGPIFGNPELDKAVLAGRDIMLRFGDEELAFRAMWAPSEVSLDYLHLRWGEREVHLKREECLWAHPLVKNPVAKAMELAVRCSEKVVKSGFDSLPPRTWAFLKAFAE